MADSQIPTPTHTDAPNSIIATPYDSDSESETQWTDATSSASFPLPGTYPDGPGIPQEGEQSAEPQLFWGHPLSEITRDAVPWPGGTYIVIHVQSGRALGLLGGRARLVGPPSCQKYKHSSPHWTLLSTSNFLGLRNTASATHLGRDFPGRIVASATHHRWWEYFCARRHPSGAGYVLYVVNFIAECLEVVSCSPSFSSSSSCAGSGIGSVCCCGSDGSSGSGSRCGGGGDDDDGEGELFLTPPPPPPPEDTEHGERPAESGNGQEAVWEFVRVN
ncbi:hypothetical protein QBC47DRAFT_107682 [Echria macrotheca]|uniref:Uncharacterized protein n=1 Tax=Echria macrotheca TaxID=438768 RepID=A0AAJ0BLN2_9PEZI|nr:hypothetical protein QBC47DRAFT_107682 [Echria macrotheca]